LRKQAAQHLLDLIYRSAVTFTTMGAGELTRVGPIRFLRGTEALTGFVLIAWSASFTYLEMVGVWRNREAFHRHAGTFAVPRAFAFGSRMPSRQQLTSS
jgi:hypothetical protein